MGSRISDSCSPRIFIRGGRGLSQLEIAASVPHFVQVERDEYRDDYDQYFQRDSGPKGQDEPGCRRHAVFNCPATFACTRSCSRSNKGQDERKRQTSGEQKSPDQLVSKSPNRRTPQEHHAHGPTDHNKEPTHEKQADGESLELFSSRSEVNQRLAVAFTGDVPGSRSCQRSCNRP